MSAPLPENEYIDALRAQLEEQPWYRRFANTVTSGVGVLSIIVWLLVFTGTDIPDSVGKWVTGVLAVLTVLGVLKTKNGITPTTIKKKIKEGLGDLFDGNPSSRIGTTPKNELSLFEILHRQ